MFNRLPFLAVMAAMVGLGPVLKSDPAPFGGSYQGKGRIRMSTRRKRSRSWRDLRRSRKEMSAESKRRNRKLT